MNESLPPWRDGVHTYQWRFYVPNVDDLGNMTPKKDHGACYSIHSGSTKMCHDLREVFLWKGLKGNIVKCVAKCPKCQQVKVEHKNPTGLLKAIQVPTWKWEDVNMDFLVGFPRT